MQNHFENLIELTQTRHKEHGSKTVYTFYEGVGFEPTLTYQDLDQKAQAIGAWLQENTQAGERVLLLYPPGLEYISAFFGCLYGNGIAVPAYPPDPSRLSKTLPRLKSILNDCQASVVFTTAMIAEMKDFIFSEAPELKTLKWLATDTIALDLKSSWKPSRLTKDQIAFIQYTSGSTGSPKGVMLSHSNLLQNMQRIFEAFEIQAGGTGVSWLPPYHDMGLIGGILGGLYSGIPVFLMSPLTFLQHPFWWLKLISDQKAEFSGGPNFAYDLCARKITKEQKKALDLSHWRLAFTGAEPIRAETLKRFTDAFSSCGFREESFYACYGLAESTLIVSGSKRGKSPIQRVVSKIGLREHRASTPKNLEDLKTIVECGRPLETLKIVDPEHHTLCPDGTVGEIWLQGPSVAKGYWNKKEETDQFFHATLTDTKDDNGYFLRTGDLGFLENGTLFVTGRIKDMILIRGKNHYPQDIEWTVERSHPAIRPGCVAAFSVGEEDEELCVVYEIHKNDKEVTENDYEAIATAIRRAVSVDHELEVFQILTIERGELPKTSSGKVMRRACREIFLEKQFKGLHLSFSRHKTTKSLETEASSWSKTNVFKTSDIKAPLKKHPVMVQAWLIERLSTLLDLSPAEIDLSKEFSSYGLDSKDAVNLSGEIEDWLGCKVSPNILSEHPTIEKLSVFLVSS